MKLWYFDWNFSKFGPKCPIDNKSVMIQIMAWSRSGDRPLFELMAAYTQHIIKAVITPG